MRRYLILFLVLSVSIFTLLVPTYAFEWSDYQVLIKGLAGDHKRLFFGNSVLKHASKCDTSRASIVERVDALGPTDTIDLSRGGMPLTRMLDVVELLLHMGVKPKAIYVQLSLDGDIETQTSQRSGLDLFINTNLAPIVPLFRPEQLQASSRESYEGVVYGNYGQFSKQYFTHEKQRMTCPETIGTHQPFIKFMYWRNFMDKKNTAHIHPAFLKRLKRIQAYQLPLIIWITPINTQDLALLHGKESVIALDQYKQAVIAALKGFKVLDLSDQLPAAAFADRWCACGHLNELGRAYVANKLAGEH